MDERHIDESETGADAQPAAAGPQGSADEGPTGSASQGRADTAGAADVAGPFAASEAPPRTSMRYSRKRVLILGGSFLAGLAAVVAGFKVLGGSAGSAVSSVGDAVKGKFGPFPVRSVDGIDETPLSKWTVKVDGMVDTPLTVDYAAWSALPRLSETVDFHCVEGWTVADVQWGGVAPALLLDKAGVQSGAAYVTVYAESGKYFSALPLDLMRDPQTVLADSLAGEALPHDHGGPLRLVVPRQLGYKNVKWVSRLEVTDKQRAGYWENYGYPEDAPVSG
jgi:DMSO/TMAO reductase YedYZ molybdopterin-dependent catalytic subunit